MLRGNTLRLYKLPEILGMTATRFYMRYNISPRTWERWMRQNGENFNPKVAEFVALCNKLHLAPHRVIQSDLEPLYEGSVKELFPPGTHWEDVRFDHAAFVSHFDKRGPLGLSACEIMSGMGKSAQTFTRGWILPEKCTLRLNELFLFCDKYNIDINLFLVDPNGKITGEQIEYDDEAEKLALRLRTREQRIRQLNAEVKQLKEQLEKEQSARMRAEQKVIMLREELMSGGGWGSMIAADSGGERDDLA